MHHLMHGKFSLRPATDRNRDFQQLYYNKTFI